jgi:hypothetical protein
MLADAVDRDNPFGAGGSAENAGTYVYAVRAVCTKFLISFSSNAWRSYKIYYLALVKTTLTDLMLPVKNLKRCLATSSHL